MKFEDFLGYFPEAKKNGGEWKAKCPAHSDRDPSLSIKAPDGDGRILLHCHAGCKPDDILERLGLTWPDLFLGGVGQRPSTVSPVSRRIVSTYDYTDERGKLIYQVVRYEPKSFAVRRHDGAGGWTWNLNGVKRVLLGLPEIVNADPTVPVLVVEGEKDALGLKDLGLLATTNLGER